MLNFSLDEQQVLIKESVDKFVQKDYDFDARLKIMAENDSCSAQVWETFANLGWLAIPFAEEQGGLGARASDVSVMMQSFGNALLLEPYFETVIVAGKVLSEVADKANVAELLEAIIGGEKKAVVAAQESQSQYSWNAKNTTLENGALNGKKVIAIQAQHADVLVVSAVKNGEQCLCLVDSNADGVSMQHYEIMDGKTASDVTFENVKIADEAILASGDQAAAVIEKTEAWLSIALAAEVVGIMRASIDQTAEYMKTRKQFGVPISIFQALQHRLIDMDLKYDQTLSLLYRAIHAYENQEDSLQKEIYALRMFTAKAAKHVGEEAIQLHGGMGLTEELAIGHYAKRLILINYRFGTSTEFQKKFCELSYA